MKVLLSFLFASTFVAPLGALPLLGAGNDTCATATPLGPGTYAGLQMHATWNGAWVTDFDWYRFTVPPGYELHVSVSVTSVTDSSGVGYGVNTAFHEYSATTCAGTLISGGSFLSTNTTSVPKDYVFKTWPFSLASQADLQVTYTLNVHLQAGMTQVLSCPGALNSLGVAGTLQVTGGNSVATDNVLFIGGNMPVNGFALLASGTSMSSIPFGDGTLCISGALRRLRVTTVGGSGMSIIPLNIASLPPLAAIVPGDLRYFQVYYRDALSQGAGFNLTSAVMILFIP